MLIKIIIGILLGILFLAAVALWGCYIYITKFDTSDNEYEDHREKHGFISGREGTTRYRYKNEDWQEYMDN